ncbi:ATP-binding protein [Streptomyces sp. IBSBF 2435]|uniref:ATP-binding protein n=1 Tax=Streptomyces sp. IBSBF 2435 TaxID=2903531 RepID=UPI002FDC63A9
MQTRTKKTLATTVLGLAFAAAAGGSASAAATTGLAGTDVLSSLPVASAANLVPGAGTSAAGAKGALSKGTSALSGKASSLLPSGNHLDGNQIAPVAGLLGGLPIGG